MNTNTEELLLQSYIGKNYNKVKKQNYSIAALVLGPIYLIYKNLIIKGFLYFITIFFIFYINKEIALFIYLITNLYLGFDFNRIYLNHCKNIIDEIIIVHPNKTKEELVSICKWKGNTTKNLLLIIFFIIIIILGIIINYPIKRKEKQKIIKDTVYSLSYEIPTSFRQGKQNTETYKHYYYIDKTNNCSITIEISKEKKSFIKNEQINNVIWQKETIKETDIYQIENNNKIYQVAFKIEKGQNCIEKKELFLKSLYLTEN